MPADVDKLIAGIHDCRQQAVARSISIIADRRPGWHRILSAVWDAPGQSTFIGLTGAPGSGKSTLADAMISSFRKQGKRVGVIAVDPSSPFSGGAVLADRLRMQKHARDPGVFIRSMASRGRLGGLAPSTAETAAVLAKAGYDPIIIETVGVGQSEIDVMTIADIVLMVLVPGNGDSIQALKAGVMEISDIFVLNQADRPGSSRLLAEVQATLKLSGNRDLNTEQIAGRAGILQTVATEQEGIEELTSEISHFLNDLRSSPELMRQREERRFTRFVNLAVRDMTDAGFVAYREKFPEWNECDRSWSEAVTVATRFLGWLGKESNRIKKSDGNEND